MNTTFTPAQCRAARGLLALTLAEFARAAKVSLETLRDFEAGRGQQNRSQIEAIRAAIESVGIKFSGDGARWALPQLAPEESSDHVDAPRLPGRLGGKGSPADNPQSAAANRARTAGSGKRAPEPDPLSPDFISATRGKKTPVEQ
jgi:transcriptional regulator with XRE-family HTH domain